MTFKTAVFVSEMKDSFCNQKGVVSSTTTGFKLKINNFNDWTLSLYDYTLNPSYGGSEVGLEKYPAKLRYLQDPTFLGCQGIFLQCRRPDSDFPMDCPGSRLSFRVKF